MTLERLTQITEVGIKSDIILKNINIDNTSGISTFNNLKLSNGLYDSSNSVGASGQILSSTGSQTAWINASTTNVGSATSIGINLDSTNATRYITFSGTTSGNNLIYVDSDLTYNPSTNTFTSLNFSGNLTGNVNSSGVSTFNNVTVGGATTALVVNGNARITGILTIGTSSITLDGSNNQVNVGSGVTVSSTNGFQIGQNTLNSTGIALNQFNVSGVATVTEQLRVGAAVTVYGNTGIISATSYFASNSRRVVALTPGDTTLWYQSAAPTGWTKITTHNDKSLRVVNGTGGGSGGTSAFTSVFTSRTPAGSVSVSGSNSGGSVANQTAGGTVSGTNSGGSVSNTTLTTTEMPSHSHNILYYQATGGGDAAANAQAINSTTGTTAAQGAGGAHGHGFTNPTWSGTFTGTSHGHTFTNPTWSGSGSFTGSSMDFAVQYIDIILCSIN